MSKKDFFLMTVPGPGFESRTKVENALRAVGLLYISPIANSVLDGGDFFTARKFSRHYEAHSLLVSDLMPNLGEEEKTTTGELFAARDAAGFCEGPDHAALWIRMAYRCQPFGEWLSVLTRPMACADTVAILAVTHDEDGEGICADYASPERKDWGRKDPVIVFKAVVQ